MNSDDLVPILARGIPDGAKLFQGIIGSWNTTTGANTVSIGNTGYENMPIIGTANLTGIAAGNVVMIIGYGSDRYILGRLIKP